MHAALRFFAHAHAREPFRRILAQLLGRLAADMIDEFFTFGHRVGRRRKQ